MKTYRVKEVGELLDEPPRTIQYWADMFIVSQEEKRRGQAREFSGEQLLKLGMIKVLARHYGVRSLTLTMIFTKLRKIQGFYTDDLWGKTRDLLYVESTKKTSQRGTMGTFYDIIEVAIVKKPDGKKGYDVWPTDFLNQFVFDGPVTMIPLGQVRKTASQLRG